MLTNILDSPVPVFLSQLTRDLLDHELDEVCMTAIAAATTVSEEESVGIQEGDPIG